VNVVKVWSDDIIVTGRRGITLRLLRQLLFACNCPWWRALEHQTNITIKTKTMSQTAHVTATRDITHSHTCKPSLRKTRIWAGRCAVRILAHARVLSLLQNA